MNRRLEPENPSLWQCIAIAAAMFAFYWTLAALAFPRDAADSASQPDMSALEAWAPTRDFRRCGDFLLSYDGRTRCARWTLERLTPASLAERGASREACRFAIDPSVPAEFRPRPADYAGTGFDLGHCAAAANHAGSTEQLKKTFTPANAAPQAAALNRGPWRALEQYLRGVAERTRGAWIVTAPLWLPGGHHQVCLRRDGERCAESRRVSFFRFEALGENVVWIPTHWGKAALIEHDDGRLEARAWIMQNATAADQPAFEDHEVSIDHFETAAGLDVFSALPDDQEAALERGK